MTGTAARAFVEAGERRRDAALASMTPARFDVLFVIWQRPPHVAREPGESYSMRLAEVTQRLGLHPTTVWKCVKRMQELGLVFREPDPDAPRQMLVWITAVGLAAFEAAVDVMCGAPFLEQNRYFAERIRLERVRRRRRKQGRVPRVRLPRAGRVVDTILRVFAFLLRICAQGNGSWSYAVYDPTFEDPVFRVRYGYRDDAPLGYSG